MKSTLAIALLTVCNAILVNYTYAHNTQPGQQNKRKHDQISDNNPVNNNNLNNNYDNTPSDSDSVSEDYEEPPTKKARIAAPENVDAMSTEVSEFMSWDNVVRDVKEKVIWPYFTELTAPELNQLSVVNKEFYSLTAPIRKVTIDVERFLNLYYCQNLSSIHKDKLSSAFSQVIKKANSITIKNLSVDNYENFNSFIQMRNEEQEGLFSGIKHLTIIGKEKVKFRTLEGDKSTLSFLSAFPNLTSLKIRLLSSYSIGDFRPIFNLSKLRVLSLDNNVMNFDEIIEVHIEKCENLKNLTHLEANIYDCAILNSFSRLSNLKCGLLPPDKYKSLEELASLTSLTVHWEDSRWDEPIWDEVEDFSYMNSLKKLGNLEELTVIVFDSWFGQDDLKKLKLIPKLKRLNLVFLDDDWLKLYKDKELDEVLEGVQITYSIE